MMHNYVVLLSMMDGRMIFTIGRSYRENRIKGFVSCDWICALGVVWRITENSKCFGFLACERNFWCHMQKKELTNITLRSKYIRIWFCSLLMLYVGNKPLHCNFSVKSSKYHSLQESFGSQLNVLKVFTYSQSSFQRLSSFTLILGHLSCRAQVQLYVHQIRRFGL